jgi:Transposase
MRTALKVAHPLMLRAIAAAKKKNDRIDANKITDCLRCDFLPECYMASIEVRERRRSRRYRNLLVHQAVQLKNKISGLLMEAGVSYNKQKLHKVGYFKELLATNPDINEGLRPLLRLCRETLVRSLQRDSLLAETRGATHGHSCRRPDHGIDLGARSWRREAFFIDQKSRLGDGAQAPDTPVELFQDWQEITNSIFCGGRCRWWPRQQMDVWFCITQERSPRGTTARRRT